MPTLAESMNPSPSKLQLEPIQQQTQAAQRGSIPFSEPNPPYSRFLVSSLPLSSIYQPDALRQFYRGGTPQSRLIPPQG